MTTTTPAAELRAAAELLREAASHTTPGPWRTHDTHLGAVGGHTATVLTDRPDINDTDLVAWLPTMSNQPWDETRNAWRNAGWMALMDPSVGLALADWLDSVAARARRDADAEWVGADLHHALAVARQILGTTTGQPETAPAVDRATVLREAADALDNSARLRDLTDDHMSDVNAAADELRRLAVEAQQPTPAPAEAAVCGDSEHRHTGPCALYAIPAPAEETKPEGWVPKRVSLGTSCAGCRHARNWHTGDDGACTVGECTCARFNAAEPTP